MAVKMLSAAMVTAMAVASAAGAQSLAQIGGPANLPPASYKGQQFVDARGCLFLRAGLGGSVNWVARVDRNHKPICGMAPTGSAAAQAAVAADMAPDAQAAAPQVTVPTVAQAQTAQAAPSGKGFLAGLFAPTPQAPSPAPAVAATVAPAAPTGPAYQGNVVETATPGVQCYTTAPKLESVKVTGGTALVCTRGDGSTSGWRPPMVANTTQAQVAAQTTPAMTAPVVVTPVVAPTQGMQVASVQVSMPQPAAPVAAPPPMVQAVAAAPVTRSNAIPKPPKGWMLAWKDDRLNPMRGIGTPAGQAMQDLIWQHTIPMVLVGDPLPKRTGFAGALGMRVSVSTMSAPEPVVTARASVAGDPLTIQIGSFSDPDNAQGAAARLTALGLPVSTMTTTRNGKALVSVSAGPFASTEAARSGLANVHGAGFSDAYLR